MQCTAQPARALTFGSKSDQFPGWGTPPRNLQACTLGYKGDLWLQARPERGWWRVAEQLADRDLCPQLQPELASLDGGAPQGKWQTWTFGHIGYSCAACKYIDPRALVQTEAGQWHASVQPAYLAFSREDDLRLQARQSLDGGALQSSCRSGPLATTPPEFAAWMVACCRAACRTGPLAPGSWCHDALVDIDFCRLHGPLAMSPSRTGRV